MPSLAVRSRWMARLGITTRSRSMLTSLVSTPLSVLTSARPATDNGRSNQVEKIMPPYFSVLSCTYLPLTCCSGLSLILKVGESLWLAMMWKEAKSLPGTLKAMMEERLRVTKYLPPSCSCHFLFSNSSSKPSSTSVFLTLSMTWKQLGDFSIKSNSSCTCSKAIRNHPFVFIGISVFCIKIRSLGPAPSV